MNKHVKSKIWAFLVLMVIFFIPFPTTFTETVDQETKQPVEFLAGSPIHANFLAFIVVDDKVEAANSFITRISERRNQS